MSVSFPIEPRDRHATTRPASKLTAAMPRRTVGRALNHSSVRDRPSTCAAARSPGLPS
jgi:hypothetical protein